MLVFWLLELHLTELNEAQSALGDWRSFGDRHSSDKQRESETNRDRQLREQFRFFLSRPAVLECLRDNVEAANEMMNSHGDMDAMLYFADLMKDYETVVDLYVRQKSYHDALKVMQQQSEPRLFYKFSPTMIDAVPQKLIDAWMAEGVKLNPKSLLPSLFNCDGNKANEAMRYLEFSLNKLHSNEPAVHNYILWLYAKFDRSKLLDYLKSQGVNQLTVCYDLKFALRICAERGFNQESVHIYCVLGLYEEAVTLALKESVQSAIDCVRLLASVAETGDGAFDLASHGVVDAVEGGGNLTDAEERRRKLWLTIARHVVEKEEDIEKCMDILRQSEGLLKVQDLLPFFPEFATIEHFKDSLCACLKEHSGRIQELQREMKEATEVAREIREDMSRLRTKYTVVRVQDKCSRCSAALMTRAFYAFPCHHLFHSDCLEKEMESFLSDTAKDRLDVLRRRLAALSDDKNGQQQQQSSFASSLLNVPPLVLMADNQQQENGAVPDVGVLVDPETLEQNLANELDDILAAKCPWCSDLIIDTIDKPFFAPKEYVEQLRSWGAIGGSGPP